jgi:DNA-binding transcriptional MerR regulator
MENREDTIEKMYYSIGEVANKLNVASSLIRFYEKEFAILNPIKTKGGNRKFTKDDIHLLERIIQLIKVEGFTIAGAQEKLKIKPSKEDPAEEIKLKLLKLKTFLIELKTNLS